MAAVGGENFAGLWDNSDIDCVVGSAILGRNQPYTYADFRPASGNPPPSDGPVDLTGEVQDTSGTPLCSMVLASGQFQFSCDGTGNYSLNIPLDANGQFKLQVYADGFAPEIQTFDEFMRVNDVPLARASECN